MVMQDGYVLAVDYGDKRVGFAVGHTVARLPEPLITLENGPTLLTDIVALVKEQQIAFVVVGIPRNMDGSLGPQAEKCRKFGEELAMQTGLSVEYVEETLSSVEATDYLMRSGAKEAGLDAVAAAFILERYFIEGGQGV